MPCQTEHYCREHVYAEMLCYVLTRWAKGDSIADALRDNKELRAWWEDHQEADRYRLAQEAAGRERQRIKAEAVAKLTPEERAALGLNDTFR